MIWRPALLLFMFGWLLIDGLAAHAQIALTPTPAVTITGGTSEAFVDVYFPEGVRLQWTVLGVPAADLTAVRLTIAPANQPPTVVTLTPDEALFTEPSAVFTAFWPLPLDAPPPLFAPIPFTWEAERGSAMIAAYSSAFSWEHTVTPWSVSRSANIQIAVPVAFAVSAQTLADSVQPIYDLLLTQLAPTIPHRFNWLIYSPLLTPNCQPFGEEPGLYARTPRLNDPVRCRPGSAEAAVSSSTLLSATNSAVALSAMQTQLVEAFYAPYWDSTAIPAWFRSALIRFYSPAVKDALYGIGLNIVRTEQTRTLTEMDALVRDPAWEAQAYGMLLYTADRAGFDRVFALAAALTPDEPFAVTYERVIGLPLAGLIPAWERWMITPHTQVLFGLTPYQPPTSTPTLTLTPTITRTPSNTPTPTPTPSWTPTPTATPTGVLSPTPFITATPPPSPTAAPATVTPRPASALFTLTPTPAVSPVPGGGFTPTQIIILGGLGLLLIVLLILLIRSGGQRRY